MVPPACTMANDAVPLPLLGDEYLSELREVMPCSEQMRCCVVGNNIVKGDVDCVVVVGRIQG